MRIGTIVPALLVSMLLAACGSSSEREGTGSGPGNGAGNGVYDARITRTTLGIPHIVASDFGSMGYGYGYAFAEDNICVLLEDLLTIRGERARYFGRDGSYSIRAAGVTTPNVDSDFFWKLSATDEVVNRLRDSAAPDVVAATTGYKDGLNRYIRELQAGQHAGRHPACRDAEWLQEIDEDDMYRRYYRLSVIASSSVLSNEIANASPPLLSLPDLLSVENRVQNAFDSGEIKASELPWPFNGKPLPFGSNMYGLGPEATTTGEPMLFGNPHFPWSGTERLYIAHLTIPGEMDIMGASLYGVPAILIGFNDQLAWSHTVSTAYRFTLYHLLLNPLNPYQYTYDGGLRDIEKVPLEIEILESDGSIVTEQRTLHRSHYGPILELVQAGIPVLGWDNLRAYSLRDANAENDRLLDQFFAWNKAQSLDEFKRLHGEILGIPWVNTVAAGPGQPVYYGDVSVVPNVPDDMVADCQPPILGPLVNSLVPGLPLLRGNRADCEWRSDDDAPAPGIFGTANLPKLERNDWVHNCNDSYWLTHPDEPLTGFARIIGDENAERTLRTRLCILHVQDRLDGIDGRGGNRFSMEQLKDVVLSSEIYSARLARDNVVSDICGGSGTESACNALAGWDRSGNPEARGAHVWREFWRSAQSANNLWSTPFSVSDPVNTPRDLNTGSNAVQQALVTAQERIDALGIAADAEMGTLQISGINRGPGNTPIPVPGGEGFEGAFTIANSGTLNANGYPVTYGNSYIQAVTWENGRVRAEGFITYSQSTDPTSPHFSDFTREYAEKRWHRFPFQRSEIDANAIRDYRISE
jgi:acyl-homoserine-lactone acylase